MEHVFYCQNWEITDLNYNVKNIFDRFLDIKHKEVLKYFVFIVNQ